MHWMHEGAWKKQKDLFRKILFWIKNDLVAS